MVRTISLEQLGKTVNEAAQKFEAFDDDTKMLAMGMIKNLLAKELEIREAESDLRWRRRERDDMLEAYQALLNERMDKS